MAASVGMAGCLGNFTGGNNSGTTEVVLWHGEAEQDPKSAIDNAIKSFNEEHDNIEARAQVVNERQISNQIIAGAQTETLPNIIQAQSQFMGQVASADLLSADAARRVVEEVGKDKFFDGVVAWSKSSNEHMMVPHYAFVTTFWWRKSVFEEQGLDAPGTWDALRASAEALHDPDNDKYGIAFGTEKHNFTRFGWEAIALSNGARVLDKNGNVIFDNPKIIESLDFYAELAQYNPPGKHNYGVPRDLYINKSVHNSFWSSFLMTPIFEGGGEKMGEDTGTIKYLKRGNTEAINGTVQGFGILSENNDGITKEQIDASVKLTKWLYKPESYIPLLLTRPGGYRPVIDGILDSAEYQDSPVVKAWGDTMQQMSKTFTSPKFTRHGLIDGKQFPEFGNVIGQNIIAEAIVKVIDGADAAEVAAEYQPKIKSAMNG